MEFIVFIKTDKEVWRMKKTWGLLIGWVLIWSISFPVWGQLGENKTYQIHVNKNAGAEVLFKDGETVLFLPNEETVFLMINNCFFPNVTLLQENGSTLVSARLLSEALGGQIDWNTEQKTVRIQIENEFLNLKADSDEAQKNGVSVKMPTSALIREGSIYVPLRFVAESFSAEVDFQTSQLVPNGTSLISIDNRIRTITQEEAVLLAKEILEQFYTASTKNKKYVDGNSYEKANLSKIRSAINKMEPKGKTAGYWILSSSQDVFVDRATGEVYFKTKEGFFSLEEENQELFFGDL